MAKYKKISDFVKITKVNTINGIKFVEITKKYNATSITYNVIFYSKEENSNLLLKISILEKNELLCVLDVKSLIKSLFNIGEEENIVILY